MIRALSPLPLLLALALGPATSVHAQSRHDSNAPIDFSAQHIELQDRAGRVVLAGSVRVSQASMTLTSARMTISYVGDILQGTPEAIRARGIGA
jgi:lipopolysaccharide export system protein LptA